jgi:ABC-2 type transport system permease protein
MTTVAAPAPRLEAIPRPASAFQRNLNLARELAFTSFKLKYTGSALGYLWSLVKPMMLFGIMYAVFARLLRAGANAPEFAVQLLLAIILWNFFVESTATAINSIASAGHLIRKAYFPRWILVVSSTLTALMTFLINIVLILLITVPLGHMHLSVRSLAAPVYFLELVLLLLGLSLLLASAFVFYRDVGHIWEIAQLVLFYGSAIVFPFTLFVVKGTATQLTTLGTFAGLNPIAQIVEDLRHALVSPDIPSMEHLLGPLYVVPIAIVLIVFVLGYAVFRHLTPRFAESL